MRLAIIAAAGAEPTSTPLLGERDASLLASRLPLDDLGFEVLIVDPTRDLAEQLDEALADREGGIESLLFYASCLLAIVEEGDCFLCLDPSEPDVGDSLSDVAEVLASARARETLFVLELRYDELEVTRAVLSEALEAVKSGVAAGRTGIELITAIRPLDAHPERIPSRLTAALLEHIDESEGALSARSAYAAAVQSADFGTWPHALGHEAGAAAFFFRPGPETDGPAEAAAPAEAPPSAQRSASTPPAPAEPAAASLPSEPAERPVRAEPARFQERRPPPPSERKESTSIAWPAKRSRAHASAHPKVVIGASAPTPASSPPPAGGASGSDRPRSLMDTTAEGPEAKRLRDAAERALAEAAQHGEPLPFIEPARRNGSPLPNSSVGEAESLVSEQGEMPRPFPIADEVSVEDEVSIEDEVSVEDDVSVEDETSADIEIRVQAEVDVTRKLSSAPPPPSLRQKVAEMTVEDHIEAGDLARRLGHDDEAVSHYKKGLAKLGTTQTPERALIYVRIGELMKKGGKTRLAISNFDKALSIVPEERSALENLIALETAQENWRNVSVLEDRLLAPLEGDERARVLLASGDRWRHQGRDRRRARERYDEARKVFPKRIEPLERLLALYEDEGSIDHALDMRRRIADLIEEPRARARYYFELGEKCLFDLGREDEGYGAFELALDADPTMLEALEVLAAALAEGQEWGELERVYAKMIDKFSSREPSEATATVLGELHHRSALLFRDHLEDPQSALEAVDQELAIRPGALSAQLMAAELALELDQGQRALSHLRRAAALVPARTETYHQIFDLGQRYDALEVSYLASSVAQVLGSADDRERIIYQEHRPSGVPSHQRPLDDAAWHWLLAERDLAVDAVMCAIAPAVLRMRVAQLEAEGKLPDLPEEARQDAATSTLSVVRSIAWGSQFLGIAPPAIYIRDEAPAPLWAPFAREPATIVGRELIRGRSVGELAFLVGRHLAMRLPEHELVSHLGNVDELTACFLAAIHVVIGRAPGSGDLSAAATKLAPRLAEHQTSEERAALIEAVDAFEASGGRVNLRGWVASVDRSATRAGLLLCGDLETAVRVLREEPDSPLSTLAERLDDLYAFTVSADHARLRQHLGCGFEPDHERPPVSAVV